LRWIQKVNDDGTSRFVPADEAAQAAHTAIHGDIETFVSPIDGSVISDRAQLREHNKKHNVVNAAEFTPEFYAGKAKERADFYQGKHTTAETLVRKQEIYETIMRAERNGR
jgi:hypothetical protein